ncbi:MAG TPA: glycosyltransferase family 2 protein [Acidimicrobiales bacterium]|nr:glycosyltransferase family 2 protein [Acidimicrobiales bacterium]
MENEAPPVVAVVVTADPGAWFDETLRSLAAQDYPALSVLVVDDASAEDPTPRVAAVMPDAYVRRMAAPSGYSACADQVLEVVEGAAFFLQCHDDVALDHDVVRLMVEEAYRSNAAVVAAKQVDWNEPDRLVSVGLAADRGGAPVPLVHPGELDQEQHDAVRDVFVAPGGVTLIRADLFSALGGYDRRIPLLGEDVDFCWRAQVAGGRVIVAPAARVRHLGAASSGRRDLDRVSNVDGVRLLRRHELRTALKCYSAPRLVLVLPVLALHAVTEAVVSVVAGRPSVARAVLGAWVWNLRRPAELWRCRRVVAASRQLGDGQILRLQSRGARLARLSEALHGQHRWADLDRTVRNSWWAVTGWALVAAFILAGSRHLLAGLPPVGRFAPAGGAGHLLSVYWSGWTGSALGRGAPAPPGLVFIGVLGAVLGGSADAGATAAVMIMVAAGAVGVYRAARPMGAMPTRFAATAAYLALPLAWGAFATGDWGALAAYGAAPWVLARLGAATGIAPWSRRHGWGSTVAAVALTAAVAGSFAPAFLAAVVLGGVGLAGGSLLAGGARRAARAIAVALAASGVALGLWLPWSSSFFAHGAQRAAVIGVGGGASGPGLGQILGFVGGPAGVAWQGWLVVAAAFLPLVVGRGWRLEWAVRMWWVALLGWAAAWASTRGWAAGWSADTAVLSALGAAAIAVCAGLGVAVVASDVAEAGRRMSRALATVAGVSAGVAVASALVGAWGGRWGAPQAGLRTLMPAAASRPVYETLWAGDPRGVPLPGWSLAPGVEWAVAAGRYPVLANEWAAPSPGRAARLASDLRQAESGSTAHLGRLLASEGVRFVAVPGRIAPDFGPTLVVPRVLTDALHLQQDLHPVVSGADLQVWAVDGWTARRLPPRGTTGWGASGTARRWWVVGDAVGWAAVASVAARVGRARRVG